MEQSLKTANAKLDAASREVEILRVQQEENASRQQKMQARHVASRSRTRMQCNAVRNAKRCEFECECECNAVQCEGNAMQCNAA